MQTKQLKTGAEVREKILAGVEKVSAVCAATLGPRGRTVMIQHEHGGSPHVTKDGVTTLRRALPLKDPFENLGAEALKQASEKTVDQAGDGTTATCVIASTLIREGIKLVNTGQDPMSIKRGMDKASDKIVEQLTKMAKPVESSKDIENIATISANGDRSIGEMIAKAIDAVGRDGHITLEESKSLETKLRLAQGFEFDRGSIHPVFYNEADKQRAIHEDVALWLINGPVANMNHWENMLPMLEHFNKLNKPLVIIAENFEGEPLATLILNHFRKTLQVLCIKSPGFGSRRTELLVDMAILSGATLRDTATGIDPIKDTAFEELGHIKRIIATKDKTILVGAAGREKEIEAHVATVRAQIDSETSQWDKERTEQRLAKLTGGIGIIEVGAQTELEMKEIKDRYEDAIAATRGCIETGFLSGGGSALLKARAAVMAEKFSTGDREQDVGVQLVLKACAAPFKQIIANSGEVASELMGVIMAEISDPSKPDLGYDAQRHKVVNMVEEGIIDPAKVCKVALQNAVSVAGMLLTTEAMIANEPEEKHEHPGAKFQM